MGRVPKVKRPVGRPRKRPREDPETQVPSPRSESGEAPFRAPARIQSLLKSELPIPLQRSRSGKVCQGAQCLSGKQTFQHQFRNNRPLDEDRLFQREHGGIQSCWKWKKAELSNGEGGRVGSMGPGTARSTSSSLYTARHRPSQADHSAFYSILSRNQRLGSEIYETKQPLFAS